MDITELYPEVFLRSKIEKNEKVTILACEMLAYYESLKSRNDSDHEPRRGPLVGAVLLYPNGRVKFERHGMKGFAGFRPYQKKPSFLKPFLTISIPIK